jgi:hypothetical protein
LDFPLGQTDFFRVFAEDYSAAQTMNKVIRDKDKNVFVIVITIFEESDKGQGVTSDE